MDNRIVKIFLQIVSAIDYLHDSKIIYRNAKLNNCLIDKFFNVTLCDFGISCSGGQTEEPRTHIETDILMAPEVSRKEKYGNKVDIWSLGVILYQLMYGQDPYSDE